MKTLDDYSAYLSRQALSAHTRRNYLLRVKRYLTWLEDSLEGQQALSDEVDRDFAVRTYRMHLLQSGAKPATVNAALAAIDNFYLFQGMTPSNVKRQDLPAVAPKALEGEEQRRLLKVIAKTESIRNRTIALLMLHTGLRIGEVRQLNFGDVLITARTGEIVVRCGKNQKHRTVPINSDLREVLLEYFRSTGNRDLQAPLFVSQKGNRISTNAIDQLVRQMAKDAGIEMSAHTLRHTCLTRLVRAGVDLVAVAEIAGHSRLETTRRYSLPSQQVKANAMEKLTNGTAQA